MKRRMLLMAALFVQLTGGAHAQSRPDKVSKPATEYSKVTRYDFENDQVQGTIVQPDELLVPGKRPTKKSSLVRPRVNFIPEMIKSVEAI